jgi:hypothetical protein
MYLPGLRTWLNSNKGTKCEIGIKKSKANLEAIHLFASHGFLNPHALNLTKTHFVAAPVVEFRRFNIRMTRHPLGDVNVAAAFQIIRDTDGPEGMIADGRLVLIKQFLTGMGLPGVGRLTAGQTSLQNRPSSEACARHGRIDNLGSLHQTSKIVR